MRHAPEVEIGVVGRARDGHPIIGAIASTATIEPEAPASVPALTEQDRKVMRALGVSEADYVAARPPAR